MGKQVVFWSLCVLACLILHQVIADLIFENPPENVTLEESGYKCLPGRTILKIEDTADKEKDPNVDYNSDETVDKMRTDENNLRIDPSKLVDSNDESCKICICSADGQTEDCVARPAITLNECIERAKEKEGFINNIAYSHIRDIHQMIRRDLVWDDDDLFLDRKDKCERGGDTLCCDHPAGHRRNIHAAVRNRVWQNMRRKIPRENLLNGGPGGDYIDFVVNNDKKK